jgi:ankyrin repeat protein
VENGAKVDHTNTHGWTPLMTAAREGNRDIMEYLIQHGANVDARTDEGTSVMRVAGNHGWTDIVVWLTLMMETGSETAEDG